MPTHTIVEGDTFWNLSHRYGCTLDAILAVNPNAIPTQLQIGQVVRLPENIRPLTPSSTMTKHTIVKDDTFWRLSQQYGCTLDAILAANPGIVPEQLHIGQIVHIPPHNFNTYTISSGDTFWLLSQRYQCGLDEILALNPDVVPEQLQIGQIVRLPDRIRIHL